MMEATLAKMFLKFLDGNPEMKDGIAKSINFVAGVDQRMRAIEAQLAAIHAQLNMPAPAPVPPVSAALPGLEKMANGRADH